MNKPDTLPFSRPQISAAVLILVVFALSGCQTSAIDELGVGPPQALIVPEPVPVAAVPVVAPATQSEITSTPPSNSAPPATIANTGQYPVIGLERVGETSQLTKADTSAIREELLKASENSSQRVEGTPDQFQSELEALRQKAKSHGQEALKKIEGPAE